MKKYVPLIALGFMGVALAAEAPAFEEVDANADGSITKAEAAVIEGLDFAMADANGDGALSKEEYKAVAGGGSEGQSAE